MYTRRKQSAIWMHYTDDGEQRARCKYCNSSISIAGGSNGNLNRHLRIKHKLAAMKATPHRLAKVELPANNTQIATTPKNVIGRPTPPPPPPPACSRSSKAKQIDNQVLRMVVKGHHSLGIVEEPEFKKFIQAVSLSPGYILPTAKKLSNNIMPNVRNEMLYNIKCAIRAASAVCLSIEEWTSTSTASYLAVTANYIDGNSEFKSHFIDCDELAGRQHTAEEVAHFLKSVITDYQITTKVTAIVSDNPGNIVAVAKGRIGCFAHSLNLIVNAALFEIGDIVAKVKCVVNYFHTNPESLKQLLQIQSQLGLPDLKLKQNEHMDWKSTYEMLQRIEILKDALVAILSLSSPDLLLELYEWELVGEIIPILKPFYEVALEIIADKIVTLPKAKVLSNLLEGFITNCVSTNEKVSCIILIMKKELEYRFRDIDRNTLYGESTILDPRFKKRAFKNNTAYENALENVRKRICLLNNDGNSDKTTSKQNSESSHDDLTSTNYCIWNDFDKDDRSIWPKNNEEACMREFQNYLDEDCLERTKDPLVWWRQRKLAYPRVYAYAVQRLCIVATYIPCDRIYYTAGRILNERREPLNSKEASSVAFLYNNM